MKKPKLMNAKQIKKQVAHIEKLGGCDLQPDAQKPRAYTEGRDLTPEEDSFYTEEQEKLRKEAKAGKLGIKFDGEKTRFDLLPWNEIKQVADVFTLGAKKYADENWKFVPEGRKRYFAATMRHLVAWKEGEKIDKESGISHLAHAICCLLFLLFFDNQDEINK